MSGLCSYDAVRMKKQIDELEFKIQMMRREILMAADCLNNTELNPNLDTVWASKWETLHDYLIFIAGEE